MAAIHHREEEKVFGGYRLHFASANMPVLEDRRAAGTR
jgi:hypothetical protein